MLLALHTINFLDATGEPVVIFSQIAHYCIPIGAFFAGCVLVSQNVGESLRNIEKMRE